ncbi:hypothetical protein AHF37_08855 [Paragonimus kellicotti]|nr:hypothetical protein AHF37_08855 [Paragonimus kellicotti]
MRLPAFVCTTLFFSRVIPHSRFRLINEPYSSYLEHPVSTSRKPDKCSQFLSSLQLICENTNEIRELHDRLKDVCPSEPNLATILASRKRASPSGDTSPPSTGLTSVVAGLITAQIASTESDQIDQKCLLNGRDPEISSPPLSSSPSTPPPTPISGSQLPITFSDTKTQELFLKLENAEAEENGVSSR